MGMPCALRTSWSSGRLKDLALIYTSTGARLLGALLLVNSSAFIEQYMYGRSKIFQTGLALGGEYPVVEYERAGPDGRETIENELLEATFDIVWDSYSITWEEYNSRELTKEFNRNLHLLFGGTRFIQSKRGSGPPPVMKIG